MFFIVVWQLLAEMYGSMVLPGPLLTCKTLINIIKEDNVFVEIYVTLQRLIAGLFVSIIFGILLGVSMGSNGKIKEILEPFIYIVQSVPPILYMTIAMIWFGLNGKATVFIIFIGSVPIMAVTIKEGFENIDNKLIEMGKSFKFNRLKLITEIILPSLVPYFKTGLITVFSLGWKLVIMGEVLSASSGLGSKISDARMNLETNKVFAWGIIVIILCFLFQKITSILFENKTSREDI